MANLYIDMLQLGTNSPDANRLKNYRAPTRNNGEAGDFATVLFSVLEMRLLFRSVIFYYRVLVFVGVMMVVTLLLLTSTTDWTTLLIPMRPKGEKL